MHWPNRVWERTTGDLWRSREPTAEDWHRRREAEQEFDEIRERQRRQHG